MPVVTIATEVNAPIERVFDLSRCIELHAHSMDRHGEMSVAGVTSGLMELGQEVTWRARHLGVWQTLTSRITAFNRPVYFRDSMVKGAFASFDHDHQFENRGNMTLMTDVFSFVSPLSVLGKIANVTFLTRYMETLLQNKNRTIKEVAESDRWKDFLHVDTRQ